MWMAFLKLPAKFIFSPQAVRAQHRTDLPNTPQDKKERQRASFTPKFFLPFILLFFFSFIAFLCAVASNIPLAGSVSLLKVMAEKASKISL